MRNIRITLAYDGTDFSGWQVQKQQRTVCGVLAAALERMHRHPIRVTAAGRTDAGVHATGQVANFYSDLDSIAENRFAPAINSYLPPDVRVVSSHEADGSFHARKSALSRTYRYNVYCTEYGDPHLRRICYQMKTTPDIEYLNQAAASLIGEHDFSSFSAAGDSSKSKRRRIIRAQFRQEDPFLVFVITANAFLWKMVRIILGTLLELETKDTAVETLAEILQNGDRSRIGPTAPARGLFLTEVGYGDEPSTL